MRTTTTIRSWGAICLGTFFALVTGYVLFEDVAHGATITTNHVLSLAALVAAISAGHMAAPAIRSGAIIPGLMLVVLFLASTGYVVVSSGARNAETANNKTAAVETANATRAHELKLRGQAEAMLGEAQKNLAAECKSGRGRRCEGIQATINVYTAAIVGHDARLAKLPSPKVANGYAHATKVLNSWGLSVTADWIELNMPFVIVLIAELGTIAFLHLGFGHQTRPVPIAKPDNVVKMEPKTAKPSALDNVTDEQLATVKALIVPTTPKRRHGIPLH